MRSCRFVSLYTYRKFGHVFFVLFFFNWRPLPPPHSRGAGAHGGLGTPAIHGAVGAAGGVPGAAVASGDAGVAQGESVGPRVLWDTWESSGLFSSPQRDKRESADFGASPETELEENSPGRGLQSPGRPLWSAAPGGLGGAGGAGSLGGCPPGPVRCLEERERQARGVKQPQGKS